jgi:hypothetical protein
MKESTLVLNNRYANYLSFQKQEAPPALRLYPCFPYLVNSNRLIKFDVPKAGRLFSRKTKVKLVIYDVFRNIIETLVDTDLTPGTYEVLWEVSKLGHGTYFYELSTDKGRITNRLFIPSEN